MAQLSVGPEEIESMRNELSEIGKSIRSSFRSHVSSFRSMGLSNLSGSKQQAKIEILRDVSGIIKPGRVEKMILIELQDAAACISDA
ncbi:hypothetical protein COLO4_34548 [Corchorus olitorius]|uniref:Uncharacterized protein n=1 Tax=Corchorus olitorius TaxID=93759 RepID=A0A1R3GKA2_9ROSI|nr:hypothetical protein COLO4_34548 [Corchorus olitorius]